MFHLTLSHPWYERTLIRCLMSLARDMMTFFDQTQSGSSEQRGAGFLSTEDAPRLIQVFHKCSFCM